MIANACSGVPLKSPVQKEVKSGLMSGEVKAILIVAFWLERQRLELGVDKLN